MIVVNRNWLRIIGMESDVVEALEETRGLMLTNISSFAAGPFRQRYITALMGEDAPRQLMLVGLSDRFDEARGIAASVIEICTSVDPTSTVTWMPPTSAQADLVVEWLQKIDHPTARTIIQAIAHMVLAK